MKNLNLTDLAFLAATKKQTPNLTGGDGKVLVSSDDTTKDYLSAKLQAGSNITLTVVDDGANEKVEIASTSTTYRDAGGRTAYFDWNSTTNNSVATGEARMDAAPSGAVTELYFSETGRAGAELTSDILSYVEAGDIITFTQRNDPNRWAFFTATDWATSGGGLMTIPVSGGVASSDALQNGAEVIVTLDSTGGGGGTAVTENHYALSRDGELADGLLTEAEGSGLVQCLGAFNAEVLTGSSSGINLNEDDVVITPNTDLFYINSDDPNPDNRNFTIGNATWANQRLTLIWIASNAGKLLASGSNMDMQSDWVPSSVGSVIHFVWHAATSKWREMYRRPIFSPVPASAGDTGKAGQIAIDSSYFYVCVATDTWKRAALSTW